jgi:hypothetical protein
MNAGRSVNRWLQCATLRLVLACDHNVQSPGIHYLTWRVSVREKKLHTAAVKNMA